MNKSVLIIAIVVMFSAGILVWLFIESSKSLPGEKVLQDGRDHVPEISKVDYKSNPPTSGDHYTAWITKGFYEEPRADGNLIHSLEHGYITLFYDCSNQQSGLVPQVLAQEATFSTKADSQGRIQMTEGSEGSPSARLQDMPKSFSDGSCNGLKTELKDVYNKFGPHKLIVVPRVGMDHKLVLTAWGRVLKLDSVDQSSIKKFIDAFRDNGPEHTIEP